MKFWTRPLAGAAAVALVVIAIGFYASLFAGPFHQRLVFTFMVNLIAVVGLQVFMGNSNINNLGHISFMAIAAYSVAIFAMPIAIKKTILNEAPFGLATFSTPVVMAIVIAIIITLVVALLVGSMLVRQTGTPATIATLAFLVIVHVVLLNWVDLTRGPRALYGIPVKATLGWATSAAVLAIFSARLFRDSKWGVQLRASSEDVAAASAVGVHIRRLRLAAWMISAAILSMSGILFALFVGTISPNSFYFDLTFLTTAMVILGGMRSVTGSVVGATLVTVGVEAMRYLENGPDIIGLKLPEMFGLTGFFLGLVIVLTMWLRPEGIVGDDEIDDIWLRRQKLRASRNDLNARENAAR